MFCSYTIFIYLYSCTVHFLYCFPVILFIRLSLLCTCICCHIFSYDIHILYFSYAFRILCSSYTILFIFFSYTMYFSYTVILYFSSCSCNCLYFNRIAVLCFSYHVISYTFHIHFYHDLAIHVLSIFLSCMLLLIHIFIYVPIIHVHILIPLLCHLLLISIILILYAFLSCVPTIFHLIHFGMSIIYSYHLILYSYVPIIRVL